MTDDQTPNRLYREISLALVSDRATEFENAIAVFAKGKKRQAMVDSFKDGYRAALTDMVRMDLIVIASEEGEEGGAE